MYNGIDRLVVVISALFLYFVVEYLSLTNNLPTGLGSIEMFQQIPPDLGILGRGCFIIVFVIYVNLTPNRSLSTKIKDNSIWVKFLYLALLVLSALSFLLITNTGKFVHLKYSYPSAFALFVMLTLTTRNSFTGTLRAHKRDFLITKGERLTESSRSFNLRAKQGWININNPFRGILVIGGAGSGKSSSVIEPIIENASRKEFSVCLYDFKFPALANVLYSYMNKHQSGQNLFIVNFADLSRSHRINPVSPRLLEQMSYVDEFSQTLFYNLQPELIKGSAGNRFFSDSAISIFKALLWYMKKHHPEYCTLPHVIALAVNDNIGATLKMLSTDVETKGMISSVLTAFRNKASEQLAGVIASLQVPLSKLLDPSIFWVCSGNDFDLRITEKSKPCSVVIGNEPTLSDSLSPVISLIINVISKQLNRKDQNKSVIILDEAPTLFIPRFEQIPATGRSNSVSTVFCAQGFSQIKDKYGPEKADSIVENLNNQFFGRVSHPSTAEYVTRLFGRDDKLVQSDSSSSSIGRGDNTSKSISRSFQERNILKTQDVLSLKTGEFVGGLVDNEVPYFKAQLNYDINSGDKTIEPFVDNFIFNDKKLGFPKYEDMAGGDVHEQDLLYRSLLDSSIRESKKESIHSNKEFDIDSILDSNNNFLDDSDRTTLPFPSYVLFSDLYIRSAPDKVYSEIRYSSLRRVINEEVLGPNSKRIFSESQSIIDQYEEDS